jgi:hypothetical protein
MQVRTTVEEAKVILRRAYEAKTLGFQSTSDQSASYYYPDGNRCAISHLFSEDQAKQLEGEMPRYMLARDLITEGYLVVDDPDWFVDLQRAHDDCIEEFLEMIS